MAFCQKRRVNSFGKKTQLYYYTRSIFFYYDLEMIVFFLQHRQSFWAFKKKKSIIFLIKIMGYLPLWKDPFRYYE